jgi:ATP-dependent DNA helicase PIF1
MLNDPAAEPDEQVYDCGILDIEDSLQNFGFTLTKITEFVLPSLDIRNTYTRLLTDEQNRHPRIIREHLLLNALTSLEPLQELTFNEHQQTVYDNVMNLVQSTQHDSRIIFVDGPGGTGKTFLFNAMLDSVRRSQGIYIAVAASGTAALLLKGGKTAHSTFKIPIEVDSTTYCSIKTISPLGDLIRSAKLIIWDKASMISRDILEAVDRTFKEVCKLIDPRFENVPFGGRVIVFGGDFRQVLPVIPKATRPQIVNQCVNRSGFWRHVNVIRLRTNMRVEATNTSNDEHLARTLSAFARYLLKIGDGSVPTIGNGDTIRLDEGMIVPGDNLLNLTSIVFHGFQGALYEANKYHFLLNRAILTPMDKHVSIINSILLDQFDGDAIDLYSADSLNNIDSTDALRYPVEFLNQIESGSLPPHHLRLKMGCPIITLRNLDPANGLCNGTRLICLGFSTNVIKAEIATGSRIGQVVMIP